MDSIKKILHSWFLHTLYKRIGYVIIPKPHFSSREVIESRRRRIDLLLFAVLVQSFAAMIAVVATHVVAGDRSTVTGACNRHLRETLRDSLGCFSAYKKNARPNWDANSWQDVQLVDTNSLRHLPRRSSKNCDLQFANCDIFKEN